MVIYFPILPKNMNEYTLKTKIRFDVETAQRLRKYLGEEYMIEEYEISTGRFSGFSCENIRGNIKGNPIINQIKGYFKNEIPQIRHYFNIKKLEDGGILLRLNIINEDKVEQDIKKRIEGFFLNQKDL